MRSDCRSNRPIERQQRQRRELLGPVVRVVDDPRVDELDDARVDLCRRRNGQRQLPLEERAGKRTVGVGHGDEVRTVIIDLQLAALETFVKTLPRLAVIRVRLETKRCESATPCPRRTREAHVVLLAVNDKRWTFDFSEPVSYPFVADQGLKVCLDELGRPILGFRGLYTFPTFASRACRRHRFGNDLFAPVVVSSALLVGFRMGSRWRGIEVVAVLGHPGSELLNSSVDAFGMAGVYEAIRCFIDVRLRQILVFGICTAARSIRACETARGGTRRHCFRR